jgi:hypothetical protein
MFASTLAKMRKITFEYEVLLILGAFILFITGIMITGLIHMNNENHQKNVCKNKNGVFIQDICIKNDSIIKLD